MVGGNGVGCQMKVDIIEGMGAGMVHSLAKEIKEWFGGDVFQVYAMTECQPITCPPADNPLGKPGSVRAQLCV